jgi:adenosylhomocysteine nucleosidase
MIEDDASQGGDAAHAHIGIVCALKLELAPYLEGCDRVRRYAGGDFTFRGGFTGSDWDIRIVTVEAGAGHERARRATQSLIDAHTPTWILSAGFSGALHPDLQLGDIVLANAIVSPEGEELLVDARMTAAPDRGWHVGKIATADEIVRTVSAKQSLAEQTGALAVDLESLAVARLCQKTKTRFLAVRAISDDLSHDLPPEVMSVFGGSGSLRAGAIAGALWKRPSSVKDMWRLRENANHAAERLAKFLNFIVPSLYDAAH